MHCDSLLASSRSRATPAVSTRAVTVAQCAQCKLDVTSEDGAIVNHPCGHKLLEGESSPQPTFLCCVLCALARSHTVCGLGRCVTLEGTSRELTCSTHSHIHRTRVQTACEILASRNQAALRLKQHTECVVCEKVVQIAVSTQTHHTTSTFRASSRCPPHHRTASPTGFPEATARTTSSWPLDIIPPMGLLSLSRAR